MLLLLLLSFLLTLAMMLATALNPNTIMVRRLYVLNPYLAEKGINGSDKIQKKEVSLIPPGSARTFCGSCVAAVDTKEAV